ncbi:uncharacterized protein LOC114738984 [Neltuma alba]|uniref:uncharacterized protein LOC114738984 n=1 Tax=Neltuma alba TaxID=207710 RepID=UPI0010A3A5F4|nr:uncharacterized protein LOC114738984 [Prosopis alba]
MAPTKRISLIANEVKQDGKHVNKTGKSSMAAGKPRSPLKSSQSESDCHNSSYMKKKYHCISYIAPTSTACRDQRVRPKGTSIAPPSNSVPLLSSTNLKPSSIRLPLPKIGYFDQVEAGREESGGQNGSENRSKALKDKDDIKISKGCSQHCEDKTKDFIRNHKTRTKTTTEAQAELCAKGKRPISHKVAKVLPRHCQAITTTGDGGDVLIELSTNQDP